MALVTGSYLIAKTLKEEGVDTLFYLMGGPNFDIVMACEDMGIKAVDFRHEQAAAFAAHAYARVTGKPGVCTAASGPGTLNLLTGVYTAAIDCAPMVILGGAGPVHEIGREAFQEVDQVSIMKPLCKYTHQPTSAARYPEIVSTAYRQATSGRPGPVYVDCGADVLYEEVEEEQAVRPTRAARRTRPAAEPEVVKEVVDMLAQAERPIIFAGGGVFFSGGAAELEHLVDITNIPFYTAPMSRGLVPGRPSGVVPGRPKPRHARGRRRAGSRYPAQLDDAIRPAVLRGRQDYPDRHRRVRNRSQPQRRPGGGRRRQSRPGPACRRGGVSPVRLLRRARVAVGGAAQTGQRAPRDADRAGPELRPGPHSPGQALQGDSGVRGQGRDRERGRQRDTARRSPDDTNVPAGAQAQLGCHGNDGRRLPYGMGAQLAKPDKQVLVLHGDGSLGMNAMEIDTCVRHNLPVVTVVSNNAGWTARTPDRRKPGRELGFTDFHDMATGLGAYGEKVEDPDEIRPALERAFDSGKPAVINVIVEPTVAGISRAWGGSRME